MFQFFNLKKALGMSFIENISNKLDKARDIQPDYFNQLNQIPTRQGFFTSLDPAIHQSLSSLDKEVYSDTSALLLMRNKSIIDGTYDKQSMIDTCINIKNTRAEVCYADQFSREPSLYSTKYFSHTTTIALDEVADKVAQLGDKEMSMQEIHDFSKDCGEKALARGLIVLSNSHDEEVVPALNTIFCMSFNQDTGEPEIDYEIRTEKFKENFKQLKILAGEDWVESFENKIREFDSAPKPAEHWSLQGTPEQINNRRASAIHMLGFEIMGLDELVNIKNVKIETAIEAQTKQNPLNEKTLSQESFIKEQVIEKPLEITPIASIDPVSVMPQSEKINFKDKINIFRKNFDLNSAPSIAPKMK